MTPCPGSGRWLADADRFAKCEHCEALVETVDRWPDRVKTYSERWPGGRVLMDHSADHEHVEQGTLL